MSEQTALTSRIEEFKAALAQDPKATVFVSLVDAYLQSGQVDDALEVALRGTWELPQFADGFAAVGRVYYHRGVTGKAEGAFFQALSVDQMCVPAYKGLASIYKDQGDIQKASDILTKAIMLDPGDASLQKMIESLSSPAAVTPDVSPVVSEPSTEQETVMDEGSGDMKPITTATIADIYVEQGLYEKALEVYRELLQDNPQDLAVQQKISELEALINSGAPVAHAAAQPQADVVPTVAETPAAEVTSAAPHCIGSEAVLDKLNDWLATIQARRNRV